MSLVARKEGAFSLFHLSGVVSGTFQPFPACYGLFWVIPLFTSDDVTECFNLQIYYKSASTKECKYHYKADSFFELQSGASGITK